MGFIEHWYLFQSPRISIVVSISDASTRKLYEVKVLCWMDERYTCMRLFCLRPSPYLDPLLVKGKLNTPIIDNYFVVKGLRFVHFVCFKVQQYVP